MIRGIKEHVFVWYDTIAVAVAGLCCVVYKTMLCGIQDYAVVYTRLCCVICRTMLCGMQDYAEYQQDYVI